MPRKTRNPLTLPYSYHREEPLETDYVDTGKVFTSYPLFVYFDSEEDREAFCKALKAAIEGWEEHATDHLT